MLGKSLELASSSGISLGPEVNIGASLPLLAQAQ